MPVLTAPGKLAALLTIVVGCFVALIAGELDQTTFVAIVGPICGYLVGNGTGALKGQSTVGVFAPPADPPAPPAPAPKVAD
jgi:hypothetical protein